MKTFEEYQDGDWVIYVRPGHEWHLMSFQAYKSKYTYNAFRLKYGEREIVADIEEVRPQSETNNLLAESYEKESNSGLPRGFGSAYSKIDSDADATGIYHVQD